MALTVPASNTDPFCWLTQNYKDDELMEFYDNNNNTNNNHYYSDYQQNSNSSYQQLNLESNNSRAYYPPAGTNMQGNNHQKYPSIDLVDSPPNSKEAWPAEYVKTIMYNSHSQQLNHQELMNRKRKIDWPQQQPQLSGSPSNYQDAIPDNGPTEPKMSNNNLKERRKSQGRLAWADDIDLDLSSELMNNGYSNDSLLNFPNLTVFKQEVPSPPNQLQQGQQPRSPTQPSNDRRNNVTQHSPNPVHDHHRSQMSPQIVNVTGNNNMMNGAQNTNNMHGQQVSSGANNNSNSNSMRSFFDQNGYDGNTNSNNNSGGNSGGTSGSHSKNYNDDSRFQYVLAAATSIATKSNEETLTYLNQGQSYEIKLKKLGELSGFRGKIMRSVIKICFHERRLQYMEREQICIWQASRPGERILDIDIPLSYGLLHVNQSMLLNTAEILWDPFKEVGVYIKVNCISTEFCSKKHGGEKGVPFRIQIETYLENGSSPPHQSSSRPLHAAACQIKVFKLKGADRKHKQDRERIQKRPPSEQDKYQRSYECTILNDISSENLVTSSIGCYSPEQIKRNVSPILSNSPVHVPAKFDVSVNPILSFVNHPIAIGSVSSTNNLCKIDQSVVSTQNYEMDDFSVAPITKDSSPTHLAQWLAYHRLNVFSTTFAHFSGSDMLRMSKDDLVSICGLPDGIKLFNILHGKAITPRLTIYVAVDGSTYNAIYLHSATTKELTHKLFQIPGVSEKHPNSAENSHNLQSKVSKFSAAASPSASGSNPNLNDETSVKLFINGPENVNVLLTDEVLTNIKDESLFHLEINQGNGNMLMKSVHKNFNTKNDA